MTCPQCDLNDATHRYRVPVTLDAQNKFELAGAYERRAGVWQCGRCALTEWADRRRAQARTAGSWIGRRLAAQERAQP